MPDEEVYRILGLLDLNLDSNDETAAEYKNGQHGSPLDGVRTSLGLESTAEPLWSNNRTTSRCPFSDADANGVQPELLRESTAAPF